MATPRPAAVQVFLLRAESFLGSELFDAHGPVLIGRSRRCGLVLKGDTVSREHARIVQRGDAILIEDLGGANGTYVNRMRVEGSVIIKPTDAIHIGAYTLKVRPLFAPLPKSEIPEDTECTTRVEAILSIETDGSREELSVDIERGFDQRLYEEAIRRATDEQSANTDPRVKQMMSPSPGALALRMVASKNKSDAMQIDPDVEARLRDLDELIALLDEKEKSQAGARVKLRAIDGYLGKHGAEMESISTGQFARDLASRLALEGRVMEPNAARRRDPTTAPMPRKATRVERSRAVPPPLPAADPEGSRIHRVTPPPPPPMQEESHATDTVPDLVEPVFHKLVESAKRSAEAIAISTVPPDPPPPPAPPRRDISRQRASVIAKQSAPQPPAPKQPQQPQQPQAKVKQQSSSPPPLPRSTKPPALPRIGTIPRAPLTEPGDIEGSTSMLNDRSRMLDEPVLPKRRAQPPRLPSNERMEARLITPTDLRVGVRPVAPMPTVQDLDASFDDVWTSSRMSPRSRLHSGQSAPALMDPEESHVQTVADPTMNTFAAVEICARAPRGEVLGTSRLTLEGEQYVLGHKTPEGGIAPPSAHPGLRLVKINADRTIDLVFPRHVAGHLMRGRETVMFQDLTEGRKYSCLRLETRDVATVILGEGKSGVSYHIRFLRPG